MSYPSRTEPAWTYDPIPHDSNRCLVGVPCSWDDPHCVVCNGESWRLWTDKNPNHTEEGGAQ